MMKPSKHEHRCWTAIFVSLALSSVLARCTPFSGTTVAAGDADGAAPPDAASVHGSVDGGVTASADADTDAPDGGDAYRQAVMADAPLSYWRLNETAGPVAKDEMGRVDGTYSGGCSFGVPGATRVGTAVHFDGNNCNVDLGDNFPFTMNAAFSIEAWAVSESGTYRHVFTREVRNSTAPVDGYAVLLDTQTSAYFERYVNGGSHATPSASFASGKLTHLVATYDGSQLRIFVNGTLSQTTTSNDQMRTFSVHAFIGCAGTSNYFQGVIDEVAIYGKALDPTRVQAHFEAATL
jgi:hypothetical protein